MMKNNKINQFDLQRISGGGLDPLSLFVGFAIGFVVEEFTDGYWNAGTVEY